MNIKKFDPGVHSIDKAAELVLSAYNMDTTEANKSKKTLISLIESGNNFLGHENMYITVDKDDISGLIVCYPGKSGGTFQSLLRLLSGLRFKELINLIILNAELLHTGYTPELTEEDFYISLIVVDEQYRGKGLATALIQKANEIARQSGCTKTVLDVDSDNGPARALYEKLGFKLRYEDSKSVNGAFPQEIYTMEYSLGS